MGASRSQAQLAELAAFIQELYELGGYATWKEFADDAQISAPQMSDFQRGEAEPAGYNLLKLVRAAARRSGSAAAGVAVQALPPQPVLEGLQDDVASLLLGQAEILERIEQALQRERGEQEPAAPARKAGGRRGR